MAKNNKTSPARPRIEHLEPRLLYSVDLPGTDLVALVTGSEEADGPDWLRPLDATETPVVPDSGGAPAPLTETLQDVAPRHELILLDPATPDHHQLIEDLLANADLARQFDIVVLDPALDGIAQISEAAAELFLKEGYERCSASARARRAACSPWARGNWTSTVCWPTPAPFRPGESR